MTKDKKNKTKTKNTKAKTTAVKQKVANIQTQKTQKTSDSLPQLKPTTTQVAAAETIVLPKKPVIVIAGILVALFMAGVYFYLQNQVAATVNGTPISRQAYIDKLESQIGEETLDRMITEALIASAADKASVSVTSEEIDAEIQNARDELAAQGQDLDQILQFQGMTVEELKEQIRLQSLLGKLADVSEEASVEEVDQYLEENADMLPEEMEEAELREYAEQQLLAQQNNQKVQDYLANLRAEANIKIN